MIFQYYLPSQGRYKGFPVTYRVTGKPNIVCMLQSILCKVIESGKQIKKRRFAQEMKGIKHEM